MSAENVMRHLETPAEVSGITHNGITTEEISNNTAEHGQASHETHLQQNASYLSLNKSLNYNITPKRRAQNKPIPCLTEQEQAGFWSLVQKTECCWLWLGAQVSANPARTIFYGQAQVAGKSYKAHRVSYSLANGPIPLESTIDHVKARGCVSTLCVRPDHLEAVSMAEQVRRRDAGRIVNGRSVCKWGHLRPAGRTAKCKECANRFRKETAARRKAEDPEAYRVKQAERRRRQRAARRAAL